MGIGTMIICGPVLDNDQQQPVSASRTTPAAGTSPRAATHDSATLSDRPRYQTVRTCNMTTIETAPQAMGSHRRQPRIAPWSQWLHDLTEHLDTYGKYPDYGTVLGSWVSRQRFAFKRGLLPNDQIAQLESLPGWLWDARRDPWPGNFERLQAHLAQHGTFPTTKHPKRWMTRQREEYASGHLSDERAGLLEALPGWSWEATAWGRSFSQFVAHIDRAGRPPARRTKLYFWAGRQRRAYTDGTLTAAQIRQLESLPG